MHNISLTDGWNLTKLAQVHHQDQGKTWLDFGDLDLIKGHYIINTQKGALLMK